MSRFTAFESLNRWAWNQLEKDDEDFVRLRARVVVFKVLSEFNDYVKSNCDVSQLIKQTADDAASDLDVVHRLLPVSTINDNYHEHPLP